MAITLALAMALAAARGMAAGPRLRIVAFNTECLAEPGARVKLERFRFDTARVQHIERVAAVIEALEPDIINLEEVTSAASIDYLVRVLHEKGLTQYRGYHVESHDGFTGFDVAMIAAHVPDTVEGATIRNIYSYSGDPTWREPYTFKDYQGVEQKRETSVSRNAVYYFTIGGRKLGFLGLHLKANPDDAASNAQRTAESHVAQRMIRQEIVGRGYQPVVLGDLNDYDPDVPDRDESRNTQTRVLRDLKEFDPARPSSRLANPAVRIVRQADRYTNHWDRNENEALDGDDVLTMIDHILIPETWMPAVARVFIDHSTDLRTSDHWAVVLDLDLEKIPAAGR